MRRLLAPIICAGLILGSAAPSLAAAGRVPSAVRKVSVTLTFEPSSSNTRTPEHRTFTKAASVAQIVDATNALVVPKFHGACPMIMRLGPELTVVYRNASGTALAEASVQVVDGNKGDSGSSACFPIHYTSGGEEQSLVGNSFIRMMGRMLGTAIS
jgi:hypothetical protein